METPVTVANIATLVVQYIKENNKDQEYLESGDFSVKDGNCSQQQPEKKPPFKAT